MKVVGESHHDHWVLAHPFGIFLPSISVSPEMTRRSAAPEMINLCKVLNNSWTK
jgi:hypothetical protein